MKKTNTSQFIEKSIKKHGNRYDYSSVNYIDSNTKIDIICNKHGIFTQLPANHLKKSGCPKCGGKMKLTTNLFVEKAMDIHGDKYDYSNSIYENAKKFINIICKAHGEFAQISSNHLSGQGCPKCGGTQIKDNKEFIDACIKIHADKYDYSLVTYINNRTKVKIICKYHGEFEQIPQNHLSKKGCPKCGGKIKSTTIDFIKKSIILHNNKYDYSLVNYTNNRIKVKINCLKHGEFEQKPNDHLNGRGCPTCCSSKGEIIIEDILKLNYITYKPQYTFPDLKFKKKLRFDFGILNKNNDLKYLIEFQGKQHYNMYERFHKNSNDYIVSLYRDKLKEEYCLKNNIKLYLIPYNVNIKDYFIKNNLLYVD